MSVRHDWYQDGEEVTITVFIKNADKKDCNVYIKEQQVQVETHNYKLGIKLFAPISIANSYYKVGPTKIEIKLAKVVSERWATLQEELETVTSNVLSSPKYEYDWVKLSDKQKKNSQEVADVIRWRNLHSNIFSFFWHTITGWIIYLVGVSNNGNSNSE